MLLSSTAEVKALVPDFIFKRAKEVVSSGKLHDISFQGPSLQHSSATCTGSNLSDNYSLSAVVNAESSNPMCQCSCPAALKAKGNLCKHVVALLLLRTKELTKVAKDQANAAILSEFKLAEDRLVEDRQRMPTFSDSQATEAFVVSDNKVDKNTATTASSVSPALKKNQKRVLPSWFSEGYCAPNKEVKEKKVARKAISKKNAVVKEEDTVPDGNGTVQTGGGKGKGRLIDKGATKKLSVKKRKDAAADNDEHTGSEAEESPHECEVKPPSRAGRGNTRKKAVTSVKKGGLPAPKRRRTRVSVESDLSEEEGPEVIDGDCSFGAKADLALTTDDLVNLATEHLETEKRNIEPMQEEGENAVIDEPQKNVVAAKKKGSIFSVQGWNEIATKGLEDAKGVSFSQETGEMSQLPSTFAADIHKAHSQASPPELVPDSLPLGGDTIKGLDSLGTAENVMDDMLGLFFGPTLSKAVNSRLESSQTTAQDMNSNTLALPETDMLDVVLPVSIDSVPQPKKKSSLKDKIMMYLG